MSDADTLAVLVILLCLGGSMFFSGAETAITSFGDHNARRLMEEGGARSRVLAVWVEHPVRVLSTILVGNNLVNTLLTAVMTEFTLRHFGSGPYARYAVPTAVGVTTVVLLVFGEITPKAFGRSRSQTFTVPVLRVLAPLTSMLLPLTWLLTRVTNLIVARAGVQDGRRVTSDELDYLVRVAHKSGSIPADQAALLQGIFRFEDKVVRDIMVPQDRVTAIDLTWDVERVVRVAQASGHSRMPVFEGNIDHIKGVVHIKTLLGVTQLGPESIRRKMRPPMFVGASLHISDLLARFKEQRTHLSIVVDDGGHTVGVVTLEDVLEQIVGQIFDETDVAPGAEPDAFGVAHFAGTESLRSVEEMFDVEFEEFEGVSSVGDLITQLAGQIPIAGSVVVCENVWFKVLAANERKIIRVSAELVELPDEDED